MPDEGNYRLESGRYIFVSSLWKHFVGGGRAPGPTRRMLIEHYLPLVYEAAEVGARTYSFLDKDELVSPIYERLERCIDGFDPSRGVLFKTYSWSQLFGAVLDYLREVDDLSRGSRQKRNKFEELEHEAHIHKAITGDRRHIDEIIVEKGAEEGYNSASVRNMMFTCQETPKYKRGLTWLAKQDDDEEGHPNAIDSTKVIDAKPGLTPVDEEYFLKILAQYPDSRARIDAFFYLFQGDTMKEVGRLMDCSESRESQILTHVAWFYVDYIDKEMGGLPPSVYANAGVDYGDLDGLYQVFMQDKGHAAKRLKQLFRLFMENRFSDEEQKKIEPSKEEPNNKLGTLLGKLKALNPVQPT